MQKQIEIENIEELRLQEGIDDVELRTEIQRLGLRCLVNLTFVGGAHSSETLTVQITKIDGACFRGKLVEKPKTTGLSQLVPGSVIAFCRDQIHSICKQSKARES
jgi:hypothetical protein